MKTRTELIISLENEIDLCFEAKKTCDNDGPPYTSLLGLDRHFDSRGQKSVYVGLVLVLFHFYLDFNYFYFPFYFI